MEREPSASARTPTITPVYGERSSSSTSLPRVWSMRSRGHSPDRVRLSAIVLRFLQQVMRSTLPSGKVCFSLSASRFCPTTRLRRHSSASWSRYSIISGILYACLLYTSDAADDLLCVDLGGRRIIKKKKKKNTK